MILITLFNSRFQIGKCLRPFPDFYISLIFFSPYCKFCLVVLNLFYDDLVPLNQISKRLYFTNGTKYIFYSLHFNIKSCGKCFVL